MADYTDIDKLRELAEKHRPTRMRWIHAEDGDVRFKYGDGCKVCEERDVCTIGSLVAELVGLRTEVDQLRTDNEVLRDECDGAARACAAMRADQLQAEQERDEIQAQIDAVEQAAREHLPEAVGHNTLAEILAGIARQRDWQREQKVALQARIDALESSAFELAGFTRGTERAALIESRYGSPMVYVHDPHNRQLQNEPTHERVVWHGPWVPERRCPGCRQRLRDLRAANDNHTDCSVVAALGVDPQKETQR